MKFVWKYSYSDKTYETHIELCEKLNENGTYVEMPEKNTFTQFENHKNVIEHLLFFMLIQKLY